MSRMANSFTPTFYQNYCAHAYREAAVLAELRTETARATTSPDRQIGSEQSAFMGMLGHLTGEKCILEIGRFIDCSSLQWHLAVGAHHGRGGECGMDDHFSQRTYNQVYWNCINRSGFRAYDRPIRYSRNRDWCSSRYRSYNPDTGLYMSSSGRYRHCP